MVFKKRLLGVGIAAAMGVSAAAWATNGMNLEGYGPIASGMGGASFAYDNGTAAAMNNPATLGMMEEGSSRLDLALGFLGPDVAITNSMYGKAGSGGDAYWMPAIGFAQRTGDMAYGVAVFAQGGMGTEYGTDTWMAFDGEDQRSEVGVGRLMLPLSYNVNDNLIVGGSLDYVWASMDIKMALDPMTFAGMFGAGLIEASPGFGTSLATVGGWTGSSFGNMTEPGTAGRLNFSNDNDFYGEAFSTGWAGKLGLVYKFNDRTSIGLTYHSETSLDDMETGNAEMILSVDDGTLGPIDGQPDQMAVPGRVTIKDFQWPTTYGIGIAHQATDRLMLALDVKRLNWSDVMKDFKLRFEPSGAPGEYVDMTLPQNWDDQTIVSVGAAYKATNQLTLRAGFNYAKNPIPDSTVNALFPAIVEKHYTVGAGYDFTENSSLNASIAYAPEVSVTDSYGNKIDHSQFNWQVMYSHKF